MSAGMAGRMHQWLQTMASTRASAACRAAQAEAQVQGLLHARTAAFARMLVVPTLLWIPLDFAALGMAHALPALAARVALAVALLGLSLAAWRLPRRDAMWWLFVVQALGFGLLQWLVAPEHEDALRVGYGLFPYLLAAQLALFPLEWWRSLLAALLAGSQLAWLVWLERLPVDTQLWHQLWLFGLIAAVGMWTSQAQLQLLTRMFAARREATHDPLTALANRRHADARLASACAHADRHDEPLSVLMLDLDHFKRVNDHHGHAGGDQVLVALAQLLQRELRADDLPARYGGEEFLTVLPACDQDHAETTAERVRQAVEDLRIALPVGVARVTASIGIATRQAGEAPHALVARADAALYLAKERGRNRWVAANADHDTAQVTRPAPLAMPSRTD